MGQTRRPRFPLPRYPTGWFQVAWSKDVLPGKATALKYFGKDLVLFRDAHGVAKVLDAHCPHMGAHLGINSEVQDGLIVCPFHGWRFNGDGECVDVPYAQRIPKRATVECWVVHEVNEAIMVWHDIDRGPPQWEVPTLSEFGHEDWSAATHRQWRVRTHNQEMAENMVDTAHFKYLHGTLNQPEAKVDADGHILKMTAKTVMSSPAGEVEGNIEAVAYGFGFSTNRFTGLVETLLIGAVAPVDDDYCDVRFSFVVKKIGGRSITEGVGQAFVAEISRQLEQDAPVWENKIYLERPLICDGDGPVGRFRVWCKQFYPEWYRRQAREAFHGAPMRVSES